MSNPGLFVTAALADALARRDVTLVASINRDTYKAAATAAKRHAGPAVLVLDRGIATVFHSGIEREPVAPARVWDESFDPELQLLLSPFGWREPWHQRSGPRRDALVIDLADVVVACDVRPGGNMERECLRAARAGKRVFTVDRAPSAGRQLWQVEPSVCRLPWEGAENAVGPIISACPGDPPGMRPDRADQSGLREVAQFLARACRRLSDSRSPAVDAYPTAGPMGETARAWSGKGSPSAAGSDWLLANLWEGDPGRVAELIQRTARGGYLAALVPAAWVDDAAYADARSTWLEVGSLRLAVRLPQVTGSCSTPAAAILLQRDAERSLPVLTFAPEQGQMSRFQLRRFLQEVLRRL